MKITPPFILAVCSWVVRGLGGHVLRVRGWCVAVRDAVFGVARCDVLVSDRGGDVAVSV
jgi:hypothetical protein